MKQFSRLFLSVLLTLYFKHGDSAVATKSYEIDSSEHGGPMGPFSTTCICGTANKKMTRVIGGEETEINEYPFNVALKRKYGQSPFCGAGIISERHVITSAHCLQNTNNVDISAVVGEHNWRFSSESNYTKAMDVDEIVIHPQYKYHIPKFDIAILVLTEKIEFNQYVRPVCLPNRRLQLLDEHVKVIGWGRTESKGSGSQYNKHVTVKVVPMYECLNAFTSYVDWSDPRTVCTFTQDKGIGLGDSGGPLVWLDKATNRYTLIGLPTLVHLYDTGSHRFPDMSTDVSAYISWIAQIVRATDPTARTCTRRS